MKLGKVKLLKVTVGKPSRWPEPGCQNPDSTHSLTRRVLTDFGVSSVWEMEHLSWENHST